jgi:hypothetical protein
LTVLDAITNAQTGSTIFNWVIHLAQVDLAGMRRVRIVYDNTLTGRSVVGFARGVTLDQLTTT